MHDFVSDLTKDNVLKRGGNVSFLVASFEVCFIFPACWFADAVDDCIWFYRDVKIVLLKLLFNLSGFNCGRNNLLLFACFPVSAMDDDANRSGGDNVRLSVTIDEHDYDIRSETGASIDGDDKDKEVKLGGNSDDAINKTDTITEGFLMYNWLCFLYFMCILLHLH